MSDVDFQVIIDAAREGVLHQITGPDGRHYVVHKSELNVSELAPRFAPRPDRVRVSVEHQTMDSYVEYLDAFSSGGSRIFASLEGRRFVAFLDYHDTSSDPNFLDHSCVFQLHTSEQWKRWAAISGKLFSQTEFVRFLEENAADVAAPSGAELFEICADFSSARKVDFREAVRLSSGARKFEWVDDIKARSGEIEVPNQFQLQIPVFYGDASQEVRAFLRYSLEDGGLKLGVELHRMEFVKQAAFEAIGREIHERSNLPLHYGHVAPAP